MMNIIQKKYPWLSSFVIRPPNDPNAGEVCSKFQLKYVSGYTVLICYWKYMSLLKLERIFILLFYVFLVF